jgi:hypothetical protein
MFGMFGNTLEVEVIVAIVIAAVLAFIAAIIVARLSIIGMQNRVQQGTSAKASLVVLCTTQIGPKAQYPPSKSTSIEPT